MKLHYVIGDATQPFFKPAVISHVCNSIGAWGSGFVISLSKMNPEPEKAYRAWYSKCQAENNQLPLGEIQTVEISPNLWVINMIAQCGVGWRVGTPPIRYEALERCLLKAYDVAVEKKATMHAPRIGAIRSGGKWETIEEIIERSMKVETYIYTLKYEKHLWDCTYETL